MPQYCVAVNCRNRCKSKCLDAQGKPITFHRFPNDPDRRQQWIAAVCRSGDEEKPWKPTACSCVCSVHFTESCFDTTGKAVRIRKDAVPTIFDFPKTDENIIPSPKAEQDSIEVAIESFTNFSTCGEGATRRYSEKTSGKVLKEHNYYCASSPKSLKLALDKSMEMEQKLWNKLGNLVKLQKRLTKRVSQLLLQLGKEGLSDGPANLQQLYSERTQGCVDMDTSDIASPVELDFGEISGKDGDVFSYLELEKPNRRSGKFLRKSRNTAENVINPSVKHEKSALKIIASTKQQVIHKEENTDTCSECGNNIISKQRTETGRQISPCLESRYNSRQSGTIPRRQWIPTKEKLYVCGECGKGFSMLASLIVHQRVHIKEKQYPCMKCGQTFSQSSNLTRHETVSLVKEEDLEASQMDHSVSEGACSTSPDPGLARTTPKVSFSINQEGVNYLMDLHDFEDRETIRSLTDHPVVAAVFLVSVNQQGEATFIELEPQRLGDLAEAACGDLSATPILPPSLHFDTETNFVGEIESQGASLCDRATKSEDGLSVKGVKRIINKQGRMLDKPPPGEARLKVLHSSSEEMDDRSLQWEQSDFVIAEQFNLDQEILEGRQSDKSDNYTWNVNNVKRHSPKSNILKNQKLYSCTECEKIFTKKSILTVHRRKHLGNKPYQCTECQKSFWKKYFLTGHLQTHFRERAYHCTACDKRFWRKSIFAGHLRIHTGERLNKCINYKKRCWQNSDIVHHRRHTSESNWCSECNKGFIRKSQLVRHQKIHSGEMLICTVCKKWFSHRGHLIMHQRKYHGMRRNKTMKVINPR